MASIFDYANPKKLVKAGQQALQTTKKVVKAASENEEMKTAAKEATKKVKRPAVPPGAQYPKPDLGAIFPKTGSPEMEARKELVEEKVIQPIAQGIGSFIDTSKDIYGNTIKGVESASDTIYQGMIQPTTGLVKEYGENAVAPVLQKAVDIEQMMATPFKVFTDAVAAPIKQTIESGDLETAKNVAGKLIEKGVMTLRQAANEQALKNLKQEERIAKAIGPVAIDRLRKTNQGYDVYSTIVEEAGPAAAESYEKFAQAAASRNIPTEAITTGLLTWGGLVDLIERPLRQTLLPGYRFGMAVLGDAVGGVELNKDELEKLWLMSQYEMGGMIGSIPFANWETETSVRENVAKQIADKYGVEPEAVHQAFEQDKIFGMSRIGMVDTLISLSSGVAEAQIAAGLIRVGSRVPLLGKVLTPAGRILSAAEKTIYPGAIGVTGANILLDGGYLGKDLQDWWSTLKDTNPDIRQTVQVAGGIAVLGTAFKLGGKSVNVLKKASLESSIKDLDEAIDKAVLDMGRDPKLVNRAFKDFKEQTGITLRWLRRPELGKTGAIRVDDVQEFLRIIQDLPAPLQEKLKGFEIQLFTSPMSEGWIAGYVNSKNNIGINIDAIRHKLLFEPTGRFSISEAAETIRHELGHLLQRQIVATEPELAKEWKLVTKNVEFTGRTAKIGEGYEFKSPGEYFAEGFRKYQDDPVGLELSDKKLFTFMDKVYKKFAETMEAPKKNLDLLGEEAKIARQDFMPRAISEIQQIAQQSKTFEEFTKKLTPEIKDSLKAQGVTNLKSLEEFYKSAKIMPEFMPRMGEGVLKNPEKPWDDMTNNTGELARERFNIGNIERIGAGSDRVVFDIGDNKVVKIAKTARGIAQNEIEGAYGDKQILGDLVPEIYEVGKNYVVMEKINPATPEIKKMAKEISQAYFDDFSKTQGDFVGENLHKVLAKYDLEDFMSYETLWQDLGRWQNWGVRNGKPVLIDKASVSGSFVKDFNNGMANDYKTEFSEIKKSSKGIKTALGETDKFTEFMPRMTDPRLNPEDANKKIADAMPKKVVKNTQNIEKYGLTPENKQKIVDLQKALGIDVRDVQSFDDMKTAAAELGTDPDGLLRMVNTSRITAKEVVALGNVVKTNTEFIAKAQKLLSQGTVKDPKALALDISKAETELNVALKKMAIANTEAGRAIVANRIMAQYTTDPAVWMMKAQKVLNGKELTPEMREIILYLSETKDHLGLAKFVAELDEATATEKLITLWKAGLLTSPSTHLRNILSNTAFGMMEDIKDIPATAIDKLVSIATGKRTIGYTSLGEHLKGIPRGFLEAWDMVKYGMTKEDFGKSELHKEIGFNFKPLDIYTKTIFRTLGAEDKVFRARIEDLSIAKQARATALNEGLKGKEFDSRVAFLKANPTDEMIAVAVEDGKYGTFNRDNIPSTMIRDLKRGAREFVGQKSGAAGEFATAVTESAMPFVRTPTNVALAALDYTPAGLFKAGLQALSGAGQKKVAEELGRSITGTGLIYLGYYLAKNGSLTGNYPSGGDEKKKWQVEGLKSGSLQIKGTQYNLKNISPVGNLMIIGASAYEAEKAGDPIFSEAAWGGVTGLTNQTFLFGLSRLVNALGGEKWERESYAEGLMSGFVPTIIRQLTESSDKYYRETGDFALEVSPKALIPLQQNIPGMRQQLPISRDILGRPIRTSPTQTWGDDANYFAKAITRMFDPFNTSKINVDDLSNEYARLEKVVTDGAYPPYPSRSRTVPLAGIEYDGKPLTVKYSMSEEEYSEFMRVYGTLYRSVASELIKSPEYQLLTDEEKANKLHGSGKDSVYKQATDYAMQMMLPIFMESKDFKKALIKDLEERKKYDPSIQQILDIINPK